MKAKLDVELKPFNVPNFVIIGSLLRPEGERDKFENGIAISNVSAEALEKLCEEFTDAVFKKAGKQRPPIDVQA